MYNLLSATPTASRSNLDFCLTTFSNSRLTLCLRLILIPTASTSIRLRSNPVSYTRTHSFHLTPHSHELISNPFQKKMVDLPSLTGSSTPGNIIISSDLVTNVAISDPQSVPPATSLPHKRSHPDPASTATTSTSRAKRPRANVKYRSVLNALDSQPPICICDRISPCLH